jgi:outer membrane receptor protein involved in Fe transport
MKQASVLIAVVAVVCASYAQTFRGGIEGTVIDSTGAAIPQAEITARNAATGLTRTTQSDSQGFYFITELPLGDYTVSASKTGFRTATVRSVRVEVSARERINLTLQPGDVKQTIEVTGEAPLVESTVNNMGGMIEGEQAKELPINGRDFTKLLVLVPGATGDPSGGADSPGSYGLFSINGSRGRSNNYLLDGTDMNDGFRNLPAINQGGVFGTPSTILPIDALAEVPIISNGEAEYGRNSGAIVNMVTRSGTNTLHGSVYEYFRNNALDARNFFNVAGTDPSTGAPLRQNKFQNNQFGGSLGGPIIKDRTFFFVAYEGQRERVGLPFKNHIPTQQDLLPVMGPCGTPPPEGINPIAKNIVCIAQPWGPIASLPPSGPGVVIQTVRASNRLDSLIGKIDQHLGKDLLTGRYFFGDSDQSFPLALLGGGTVPGYNTVTPTRVQILSLSYTHVHSSKLLMEFRGGWNRFNETFFPEDSALDPASLGLNNVSSQQDFGLPLIAISGFAPIGANATVPRGRVDTNWQWFANTSYTSGRHSLKWGYEFRRTAISSFWDLGFRSKLTFGNLDEFLQLQDETTPGGHQLEGDSRRHTSQNNHAFYLQDSFRMSRTLTLNLGLRWDYFGVIGEKNNLFSLFDPTLLPVGTGPGACTAAFCPGVRQVSQLYPKDYNNFSPRLSFAWDLFGRGKTVLRGGYGIFYDAFSQDFFIGQQPWPTFNSGPAFNYMTLGSPTSVGESYSAALNMGLQACSAGGIPVPNSGGLCAGPTFAFDPVGFGNDIFTVDERIRTPYIQNYNLNVQHQLARNVALQVGYVGSTGRKLFHYIDINQGIPGGFADAGTHPYGGARGFGYVLDFLSDANSQYHSLQTSLTFRSWHGVTASLDYTWSHSIDTASDGQDYVPNATQPDNSYDYRPERANSNFDQRHRFVANFRYDFPKGTNRLTSGWAVDGVVTLASGMPYNVNWLNFSTDYNLTGEFYGRPDVCGIGLAAPCPSGVTGPFTGTGGINLLNLSALVVPCTLDSDGNCVSGTEHMGNLPRNAFTGPGFKNFDFSIVKDTKISERLNVQLRADFFNILNHPNLGNPLWPGYSVDMTAGGLDATGHGVGMLQPSVTPDVGLGNPYLGGGGPRDIQLAVKFTF